jgi:hypothetical protein
MRSINRKRPQVNPKELRKSSDIRRERHASIVVAGKRKATKSGYRIPGAQCKDYETYFEHIVEKQSTDRVMHPKKTRTIRVIGGQGFASIEKAGFERKSIVLIPGDELTVEAGISYQLLTTSRYFLEVFVTQSAKYEANLQVVEESTTEALMEDIDLDALSRGELVSQHIRPRRRQMSKAVEQQQTASIARDKHMGNSPSVKSTNASVSDGDKKFATNLKPSFGTDLRGAAG